MPSSPGLFSRLRTMWNLYRTVARDTRTSGFVKFLPWLSLLYIIMPIDVIPDFLPVLGWIDDLGMIPLLIWLALQLTPEHIKKDARKSDIVETQVHKTEDGA